MICLQNLGKKDKNGKARCVPGKVSFTGDSNSTEEGGWDLNFLKLMGLVMDQWDLNHPGKMVRVMDQEAEVLDTWGQALDPDPKEGLE